MNLKDAIMKLHMDLGTEMMISLYQENTLLAWLSLKGKRKKKIELSYKTFQNLCAFESFYINNLQEQRFFNSNVDKIFKGKCHYYNKIGHKSDVLRNKIKDEKA